MPARSRIGREPYAELLENLVVDFAENNGRVGLTAAQHGQRGQSAAAGVVVGRENAQGNENFVGVEAWVAAAEIVGLSCPGTRSVP